MIGQNIFVGGVDRDSDPMAIQRHFARLMTNMRTRSVKGKNAAATNVGSMDGAFELTDGFVPIGYVEFQGVLFIFSTNSSTGEGEIGTYPSPALDCNGGYEHVYRPLRNFTGLVDPDSTPTPTREDLRTTIFNFDCANQIEAQARISYDNSVNLYWTDFKNPVRKINTGFNITTGICNDRYYWVGDLARRISLFSETIFHPRPTDYDAVDTLQGGALQAGNYFFYVRYADEAFNPTSWLSEIGPVQITSDDISEGTDFQGDIGLTNTGRSVEITLDNIDPTFTYLEFAFSYHYDDVTEVGRVVKYFPITGNVMTIVINGLEEIGDLTIAELLRQKGEIDTCKSLDQNDDRLWGANWKKSEVRYDDLQDVASEVFALPPDTDELIEEIIPMAWDLAAPATSQQNLKNTLNRLGYFRGESYPFAIQFVLQDGRLTYPYPVLGQDAWYDPGGATNTKGILRFPSNLNADYGYLAPTGSSNAATTRTMGVKFDTSVIPWSAWTAWMQENVVGFYILRGERKPNLIYQSFGTRAFRTSQSDPGFDPPTAGWGDGNNPPALTPPINLVNRTLVDSDDRLMPEIGIDGATWRIPLRSDGTQPMVNNGYPRSLSAENIAQQPADQDYFGFFGDDHFFKRSLANNDYTNVIVGKMRFRHIDIMDIGAGSSWRDPSTMFDTNGLDVPTNFSDPFAPAIGSIEMINVPESSVSTYAYGFTSYFYEGNQENFGAGNPILKLYIDDATGFPSLVNEEAETGNREIRQRNYIGVNGSAEAAFSQELRDNMINVDAQNVEYPVINTYSRNPDPAQGFVLENEYQPELVIYRRITDYLPVTTSGGLDGDFWDGLVSNIFFGGDCFLNRSYHRHTASGGYHDNEFVVVEWLGGSATGDAFYYKYGNLVGTILESAVNTATRASTGVTQPGNGWYYPKVYRESPVNFATDYGAYNEFYDLNEGYNVVLGLFGQLGSDPLVPFRGVEYPVRIWHTDIHESDNLIDGYLTWPLAGQKDFNHNYGPINRLLASGEFLVSVQDHAVHAHPINREALLQEAASEAELLLGVGDVLPRKTRTLSETYGSQHQWSVIKGDRGIYGYDQEKRRIWVVAGGQFQVLSDDRKFTSDILAVSEFDSDHSDILHRYPDEPVCLGGVVAFHDRRHNEIGWTWKVYIGEDPVVGYAETLVFNEAHGTYQHKRTHYSPFYMSLNDDLFSANPDYLGPLATEVGPVPFFLHDSPDSAEGVNFYGNLQPCALGWITNEAPGEEKVFDAQHLQTNDHELSRIEWATRTQNSFINPFLTPDIWLRPEYLEGSWRYPINMATSVQTGGLQDFLVDSHMKGYYLYTEATWGGLYDVSVEMAKTIFNPTKS